MWLSLRLTQLAAVIAAVWAQSQSQSQSQCPDNTWTHRNVTKKCYKKDTTTFYTWEAANTACKGLSNGANLASIHNTGENYWLLKTFLKRSMAWLGLKLDDASVIPAYKNWTDGSSSPYYDWNSYIMSGLAPGEVCIYANFNTQWGVGRCNSSLWEFGYVCQVDETTPTGSG